MNHEPTLVLQLQRSVEMWPVLRDLSNEARHMHYRFKYSDSARAQAWGQLPDTYMWGLVVNPGSWRFRGGTSLGTGATMRGGYNGVRPKSGKLDAVRNQGWTRD